jgi:hypothetical protein
LLAAPLTAQKRHRYYEGSDSRRPHPSDGSHRLLRFAFPQANAVHHPGRHSDPNHAIRPMVAFSRLSAIGHSRLRPYPAGSPRVHAETGSCSYRLAVRLQLLPTPPLGDAVTFGYKVTTHSDRGFHPADKASSRTHWMAGTGPAMTNLGVLTTIIRDENFASFKRYPIRVMPGLVPGHPRLFAAAKTWMAGQARL